MQLKKLQIDENFKETIAYNDNAIPVSTCVSYFDEYFQRQWNYHWHEELEFAILLSGCVEYTIYDETQKTTPITLLPGDGIFINSGRLHSAKALTTETIVADFILPITFFDAKPFQIFSKKLLSLVIESDTSFLFFEHQKQEDKIILSSIQELCEITEQENCFELHCIEMVCRIWRLITDKVLTSSTVQITSSHKKLQLQRLKKMLSYIHSHYNHSFTIQDMLKYTGISRSECFRCFQNILNKTPIQYIREYRLSMAMMLLANTTRTLSDISFSCGFQTPSYFGKEFRKQYGSTPKTYREQLKSRTDKEINLKS
ncbi:helix-turn-helix domain-containing protein [Gallibacterium salpingitidis]|uniref:HTH araC/xylS-type domain-containing protein n=1 Tax=Gallibacterium salpingitidis TaxID=505341 RepID=A0A1A7NUK4_9PAST|nr:AraC family transcriptional regulator [Gallibacterium salpingitidis]OBW93363.1 hypothetical protein QS62_07515 [Gallibacterium salpingitidis]